MILDFIYKTDPVTGRITEETGGLKKYILPVIRSNKIAEILSAFSIVLFENFYKEKILPKKNRYNIPETSADNLKNIIWELGHELTIGDFYTNSIEYFQRQARTLSRRILTKNTRLCYRYLYYVYGFKYNYSYRANAINKSNRITDIQEGTDNISIGASVYGEGIEEGTFVISKGLNYVDLSKNINFRANVVGYGLIYSFYNEDIDVLLSAGNPLESLETLKGKSVTELVDIRNYYLDNELKTPVLINIDQIISEIPEFQDLTFYSKEDSPKIIERSGVKYLYYDYLSLDENEPIYLAKPDGLFVSIPKADLFTWYLDYSEIAAVTTRHFILNYIMNSVETDTDFITKSSCEAFYNDIQQTKRIIEVPHFEPKLSINIPVGTVPPNPLNTSKYPNLYTYINSSGVTRLQGRLNDASVMTNICFEDKLSQITHIQFGKSRRNLDYITLADMDELLNDGLNNRSVAQTFENEDLSFNSIEFKTANTYRFLNPLNYVGYKDLFKQTTLPDLDSGQLTINNNGILDKDAPYYQLTLQNRWSFPIEYFKLEKINTQQLLLRNYLFPYFKWSSFSEISFLRKNYDGTYTTLIYCSFPTINYSQNMLSSIYINLYLDYNFDEVSKKISFNFSILDWVQEVNTDYFYLEIPYANKSYDDYIAYSFNYVKPEDNDPNDTNYYFFQNIGYNPFYYIYRIDTYDSELNGFSYEKVDVDSIIIDTTGTTKIRIKNTDLSPFAGKLVLI